jgi:hypothetical protein
MPEGGGDQKVTAQLTPLLSAAGEWWNPARRPFPRVLLVATPPGSLDEQHPYPTPDMDLPCSRPAHTSQAPRAKGRVRVQSLYRTLPRKPHAHAKRRSGTTPLAPQFKILRVAYDPLPPQFSRPFQQLVNGMLRADPDDRPTTQVRRAGGGGGMRGGGWGRGVASQDRRYHRLFRCCSRCC